MIVNGFYSQARGVHFRGCVLWIGNVYKNSGYHQQYWIDNVFPDRSAVEIQYAAVYTEGTVEISIRWESGLAVYLQDILQTSWSVHSVYTATVLPYTVSLLHFSQGLHCSGSCTVFPYISTPWCTGFITLVLH